MDQKHIELTTMYTPYTLDSYNTFTFDAVEEQIIENDNEQNDAHRTYDDFDWIHETKKYLHDLGVNLVKLLNENILDDVILKVTSDNVVYRPREYNFTTDEITLDFIVNADNLKKYIDDNKTDYEQNKIKDCPGFYWLGDEDQTMLNYYLATVSEKIYKPFDYMIDQLDQVSQWDFVECTPINA